MLFHNDIFYCAGWDGGLGRGFIMVTPDGVHFSANLLPTDLSAVNAIAFGNGLFIAVADAGKVWVSKNGISWTLIQPSAAGASGFADVVYGGGRFVAFTDAPSILYSEDGVTWNQAVPPSGGFPWLRTITVRP
jgi:hypothetical protein